jgi:hypothetical protein
MLLGTTTHILGLCIELIRLDLVGLEFCTFPSFSIFNFYFSKNLEEGRGVVRSVETVFLASAHMWEQG